MRKSLTQYKEEVLRMHDLMKKGLPLCIFDIETTGLNAVTDSILSFSAIKIALTEGVIKEVEQFDILVNPGYHIPENATLINGITDQMVQNAPYEEEAYEMIRNFFGDSPLIAGYGSENFDVKFVQNLYLKNAGEDFTPACHLDIIKMVKEMLEVKDLKLSTAASELGCDMGITFHKSMDDVIASKRMFELLLAMYINQEADTAKIRINVLDANYWAPRHDLTRIYLYTFPKTSTYYDVYRKEWVSDMDMVDMDALIKDTLTMFRATDEKCLVKVLQAKKKCF